MIFVPNIAFNPHFYTFNMKLWILNLKLSAPVCAVSGEQISYLRKKDEKNTKKGRKKHEKRIYFQFMTFCSLSDLRVMV